MTLPPEFEYGWAAGEEHVFCIHKVGVVGRMLCGRRVNHISRVQPEAPSNVHRECLEAMYGRGEQPPRPKVTDQGTCPVCGGEAAVVEGRIARHGAWHIRGNGEPYVSSTWCRGEGERPVEES